jgi:hypothetical protein
VFTSLFFLQSESRVLLSKLVNKYPPEIDASVLQKILRGHWKSYLLERPSLELCKSLVMLRDYNISGRVNLMEIPLLLHLLHFWRVSEFKRCLGVQQVSYISYISHMSYHPVILPSYHPTILLSFHPIISYHPTYFTILHILPS